MATIENNLVIQGLSGQVGSQLGVHRIGSGPDRLCAAPVEAQQSGYSERPDREHLRLYEALLYSRMPRHVLDAKVTGVRPSGGGAGVSADVIHPPEIHSIDISKYTGRAGELIRITAGDDVYVASVGVLIVTDDGILVESGSAILSDKNPYVWTYRTTKTAASRFVRILVDVADVTPQSVSL